MNQNSDNQISSTNSANSTEHQTVGTPVSKMANLIEELQRSDDRIWGTRLCSDYFADVIPSDSNNEYRVLGVLGKLYILADDIALITGRTLLEILDRCGHGNELYYPEPELPYPLENAVPGTYVPLSRGLSLIPSCDDWYYDMYELVAFRNEFERRKNDL